MKSLYFFNEIKISLRWYKAHDSYLSRDLNWSLSWPPPFFSAFPIPVLPHLPLILPASIVLAPSIPLPNALKDVAINEELLHFNIVSTSTSFPLEALSTSEFINNSLAVSLSHLKTVSGRLRLKKFSQYCATHSFIQICSQRELSRRINAEISSSPSQTECWTVFDPLFVLILYEVVVLEVVDKLWSQRYNKQFLLLNIFLKIRLLPWLALSYYI